MNVSWAIGKLYRVNTSTGLATWTALSPTETKHFFLIELIP